MYSRKNRLKYLDFFSFLGHKTDIFYSFNITEKDNNKYYWISNDKIIKINKTEQPNISELAGVNDSLITVKEFKDIKLVGIPVSCDRKNIDFTFDDMKNWKEFIKYKIVAGCYNLTLTDGMLRKYHDTKAYLYIINNIKTKNRKIKTWFFDTLNNAIKCAYKKEKCSLCNIKIGGSHFETLRCTRSKKINFITHIHEERAYSLWLMHITIKYNTSKFLGAIKNYINNVNILLNKLHLYKKKNCL